MTLKFNPLSRNGLDYFLHQGIASYKFTGWKELELMTDPGAGNFYYNFNDFGIYAVMSITDIHGYFMIWNLEELYWSTEYYDVWLYMHGKSNSDQYLGCIIIPDEEWTEILDEAEENLVALAIPIWFVFFPAIYDEEEDELWIDEFPENDEILISFDLSFNPELVWNYVGSLGMQDYDDVYITGGTIGAKIDTAEDVIVDLTTKGLVLKDTQVEPHYWRVTIEEDGALVTTDCGTVKP